MVHYFTNSFFPGSEPGSNRAASPLYQNEPDTQGNKIGMTAGIPEIIP